MFNVYFVLDDDTKDFLQGFPTLAEAEEFKAEQIEKEGWDDGDHDEYISLYIIEPQ